MAAKLQLSIDSKIQFFAYQKIKEQVLARQSPGRLRWW